MGVLEIGISNKQKGFASISSSISVMSKKNMSTKKAGTGLDQNE